MTGNQLVAAILDGTYDEDLSKLQQAVKARLDQRFAPGTRVRVKAGLPARDKFGIVGKVGVIEKANQRTVSVILDVNGENLYFNVTPNMLEVL